jgi:protein-S-isoprenylcysteine O-methyltransferase Ste14
MLSLRLINILLLSLCFLSFSWAAICFFSDKDSGAKIGKQIISVTGILAIVFYIYNLFFFPTVAPLPALSGLVLFAASLVLFWWSINATRATELDFAFTDGPPKTLIFRGPYKYARHPFYLSYTLTWLGGAIASENHQLYMVFIVMLTIYFLAARKEEKKFSLSPLKDEYNNYASQVGMFFPKRFRITINGRE